LKTLKNTYISIGSDVTKNYFIEPIAFIAV